MAHMSTASSDTIISALATIHLESNKMEPKMWMDIVKQVCVSSLDDSIMSVLQHCHAFSSQEVGVVFLDSRSIDGTPTRPIYLHGQRSRQIPMTDNVVVRGWFSSDT
jgi:hypothetical protein